MCLYTTLGLFVIFSEIFLRYYVTCYKNHSALSAIVFTNIEPPDENTHSEYFYGKCATKSKKLLAHQVWEYEELVNKLVVRAWLDLDEVPDCVYIRSKSAYTDSVKYHAFKFNVCVCVLVYNYGGRKYTLIFYEWYIPVKMMKDMKWDLFFYQSI